jgi:DNA polymerase III epsilon subunit-like protein
MLHVMVDLETLSTKPTARILSIGACYVNYEDPAKGPVFYHRIKIEENPVFDTDFGTLAWWNKQNPETKAEAFSGVEDLVHVLAKFQAWFPSDACIWSNGANFDIPVLSHAFGFYGLKEPWSYKNTRCYRTLKEMFAKTVVSDTNPNKHNALTDAIVQAMHLQKIMQSSPQYNW